MQMVGISIKLGMKRSSSQLCVMLSALLERTQIIIPVIPHSSFSLHTVLKFHLLYTSVNRFSVNQFQVTSLSIKWNDTTCRGHQGHLQQVFSWRAFSIKLRLPTLFNLVNMYEGQPCSHTGWLFCSLVGNHEFSRLRLIPNTNYSHISTL
jgi:hypothetical protein